MQNPGAWVVGASPLPSRLRATPCLVLLHRLPSAMLVGQAHPWGCAGPLLGLAPGLLTTPFYHAAKNHLLGPGFGAQPQEHVRQGGPSCAHLSRVPFPLWLPASAARPPWWVTGLGASGSGIGSTSHVPALRTLARIALQGATVLSLPGASSQATGPQSPHSHHGSQLRMLALCLQTLTCLWTPGEPRCPHWVSCELTSQRPRVDVSLSFLGSGAPLLRLQTAELAPRSSLPPAPMSPTVVCWDVAGKAVFAGRTLPPAPPACLPCRNSLPGASRQQRGRVGAGPREPGHGEPLASCGDDPCRVAEAVAQSLCCVGAHGPGRPRAGRKPK